MEAAITEIAASVGKGQANRKSDVAWVQAALVRHARWITDAGTVTVTGIFDPTTARAILDFQTGAAALRHPDGIVSPRGFTVRQLGNAFIPSPQSRVFSPICWYHPASVLTQSDYAGAAVTLGCQAAAVQAVALTESKKSAWDDFGRPTILFERHYFSRISNHTFDHTHPDISSRRAYQKSHNGISPDNTYGPFRQQYDRLFRAAVLNETAALQSASWGAFQIMGERYPRCGFSNVGEFVDAMLTNEKHQLDAFVALINSTASLKTSLQKLDWTAFALGYNGSDGDGNVVDGYDTRIATAYTSLQP